MAGDFGLIKSNDTAAADTKRGGTVFLGRSDQRLGIDLRFITLTQIEQQHAVRAVGPIRSRGAQVGPRKPDASIEKKWLINVILKNAGVPTHRRPKNNTRRKSTLPVVRMLCNPRLARAGFCT